MQRCAKIAMLQIFTIHCEESSRIVTINNKINFYQTLMTQFLAQLVSRLYNQLIHMERIGKITYCMRENEAWLTASSLGASSASGVVASSSSFVE